MFNFLEVDGSTLINGGYSQFNDILPEWIDCKLFKYWQIIEDGYSLDIRLPGYKKDDVTITKKERYLFINAENDKYKEKKYKVLIPERPIKTIESKLEDGILTVLCKIDKKKAEGQNIPIQ